MKKSFHRQLQNAQNNGFAIIPLIGGLDFTDGKKPAVNWKKYQATLPTPVEIQQWFAIGHYSAYGIVCGQISRLVVLDFDDPTLFMDFGIQFPQLLQTQIVRTRRGFHVYWYVDFPVQSRPFPGGDLKGEGGYVVGPGSVIGGVCWQLIEETPIASITEPQLQAVLAFLSPPTPPLIGLTTREELYLYTPDDALQLFYANVKRQYGQRNKALYQTACELRDIGYTQEWVAESLLEDFVWHPSHLHHPADPPQQRYREGRATIASAFKHEPKPREGMVGHRLPNSLRETLLILPGGTSALRLLEGLGLAQMQPGTLFTAHAAAASLQGILSMDTIRDALHFRLPDGQPIFTPSRMNSTLSGNFLREQSSRCSIELRWPLSASQGVEGSGERGQNDPLAHYCRPPVQYIVPDCIALCERLGIRPTYGDIIHWVDLLTNKTYRSALNQRLIRRRRGRYSQTWLARRLGVVERTIYTYVREDPFLHSAPTYHAKMVDNHLLECLPYAEDFNFDKPRGCFLMAPNGKCYPCKREIAQRYHKAGQPIYFVEQKTNFYWYAVAPDGCYPEPPPGYSRLEFWPMLKPARKPIEEPPKANKRGAKAKANRFEQATFPQTQTAFAQKPPSKEVIPTHRSTENTTIEPVKNEASVNKPSKKPRPKRLVKLGTLSPTQSTASFADAPLPPHPHIIYVKDFTPTSREALVKGRQTTPQRYFRQPLPDEDLERTAQFACNEINAIARPHQKLSLTNARRLVDTYGPAIVQKQINYLLKLQRQRPDKVRNPVALFITNCKGAWLNIHKNSPFRNSAHAVAAPPFTGQPKRGSRRQKRAAEELAQPFDPNKANHPHYQNRAWLTKRLDRAQTHEDATAVAFWQERLDRAIFADYVRKIENDPYYDTADKLRQRLMDAYEWKDIEDIRFWYGYLVRLGLEPPPADVDDRTSPWMDPQFVEAVKCCQYPTYRVGDYIGVLYEVV